MNDDDQLGVGCILCKEISLKVWWKIHGNYCPRCNPEFRGDIGLNFPALPR